MDERTTRILDTALLQYIARQLWEVRQLLEAERSEGEISFKTVSVTDAGEEYDIKKTLGVEFLTVDLLNTGPDTVYIRVNKRLAEEIIRNSGDSISIDFEKSREKIAKLYFRCDTGETASVWVMGKY